MSWKSLVTTGLFCLLAVPAYALPNMGLVSTGGAQGSGHLNAAGNWVWTVQVTPDLSMVPDASGTPVAAELGFTSTSTGAVAGQGNLIKATNASTGANDKFDLLNPGAVVFPSWQTAGNGLLDANSNNRPTGIQTQCVAGTCSNQSYTLPAGLGGDSSVVGTGAGSQQVFAALGSVNFAAAGAQNFITIEVQRPAVTLAAPNTSTHIQVSGVYGAGSTNGRLTQVTGKTGSTYTTSNFDTFGGALYQYTLNARGGDANLDGTINFAGDFQNAFSLNYLGTGKSWYQGDFDGDGDVDFTDFQILSLSYLQTYTVGPTTPGSGSGLGGASVPEPASVALLGLAVLGGLGVVRRKR